MNELLIFLNNLFAARSIKAFFFYNFKIWFPFLNRECGRVIVGERSLKNSLQCIKNFFIIQIGNTYWNFVILCYIFAEKKQCSLNCRPLGYKFYATLNNSVVDGTRCKLPSNEEGVCINGQCQVRKIIHITDVRSFVQRLHFLLMQFSYNHAAVFA